MTEINIFSLTKYLLKQSKISTLTCLSNAEVNSPVVSHHKNTFIMQSSNELVLARKACDTCMARDTFKILVIFKARCRFF